MNSTVLPSSLMARSWPPEKRITMEPPISLWRVTWQTAPLIPLSTRSVSYIYSNPQGDDVGRDVVIQPDGKLVVGGYFYNGSLDSALLRMDTFGHPRYEFWLGRLLQKSTSVLGTYDPAYSLAPSA